MIITRTPFRISFAGGGSDLPSFYQRSEGCVVSTSINKYMYVSIHPTFNRRETCVKYSKTEIIEDIHTIQHPIARQLLLDHKLSGVEVSSTADIPSGTGLSTSSAYTVGLIHAINAFQGKYANQEKIAAEACRVEIEELGEPIGKQDQYGTAVGGLKFIRFREDGSVKVEPIILKREVKQQLDDNLLLFYTGITHSAGAVLKNQNENLMTSQEKFQNMCRMTELARAMNDALQHNDLTSFGDILNENWKLKRSMSHGISSDVIDRYYEIAMKAGARGGKLLGAGGGGFLLFYCEKDRQLRLRSALSDLVELPFHMENDGTKVIYVGEKDWD